MSMSIDDGRDDDDVDDMFMIGVRVQQLAFVFVS